MNPQNRAERVVHDYRIISALVTVDDAALTVRIEREIEAAVREEREACATIADRYQGPGGPYWSGDPAWVEPYWMRPASETARAIGVDIRARAMPERIS